MSSMVNVKKQRMKIYVLDNGRMKMDKNLMIANSNQATMDNPNQSNEMHEFPIYTKESMEPTIKPPGILYDSGGWTNSVEKTKN
jgi:N-acyl homoserine lactone hydrolase